MKNAYKKRRDAELKILYDRLAFAQHNLNCLECEIEKLRKAIDDAEKIGDSFLENELDSQLFLLERDKISWERRLHWCEDCIVKRDIIHMLTINRSGDQRLPQ